jgi:hypothetical protein
MPLKQNNIDSRADVIDCNCNRQAYKDHATDPAIQSRKNPRRKFIVQASEGKSRVAHSAAVLLML